jgi:ABC-type glycerol-3-phosphate transport system substrate-binding protein
MFNTHRGLTRLPALFLVAMLLSTASCSLSPAPPTPTPEPITLRFAFRQNVADYRPLVTQFQQLHPGITVRLVPIESYNRDPLAEIDSQELDVVRWGQGFLTADRAEQLLPLDEIILVDAGFPRQDMVKGAMEALSYKGIQRGLPAGLNFVVAYYNVARLKAAQAAPPSPDWTLDDFLALALAVNHTEGTTTSQAGFVYGFCSTPDNGDPLYLAYLAGGGMVDSLAEPSRPTLDDPANVKAVQWYADLRLKHGVIPDPDDIDMAFPRGGLYEAIISNKCGLWFGQFADQGGKTWPVEWISQGVMLPLPRSKAAFSYAGVDGYYLLTKSQHRREAWEWMRFLLDHQEAAGMMMPPLNSQIDSTQYAGRVGQDVAAVARRLTANAILLPGNIDPRLYQVMGLFLGAVKQAVKGDTDAETALKEAQVQAEALFATQ